MEKINLRNGASYIPEALLLAGCIFCFFGELIWASSLNYLMIFGICIVSALLIWKNKYFALGLSLILGLVSFYLLLALFSEYSEFPAGSRDGLNMLLTGIAIFGSLMAISIAMPRKYFNKGKGANQYQ